MQNFKLLSSATPKKDKYIENHIYIYHSQISNTENEGNNLKSDREKGLLTFMGSAIRMIADIAS